MGDLVMKKIISIFIIASFAITALVSCSKELADPNDKPVQVNPGEEENPGEEGQGEGEQNIPEGMIRLTFSVSSENDTPAEPSAAADDTKTSWDKINGHQWSEGDQIRIIWGEGDVEGTDYAIAEVVDGQVSAVVDDADYYYAVYPATATYTYTAAEGKISVKFERGQSGSFSDANIMAAKTSKAAASFNFKNMTGIIKFTLAAESPYGSINFSANDKTVLNGWVDTTFPDTFAVTTRAGANTGKDAYNNSQYNNMLSVSDLSAGGTYYVAVLPDVTLSNGIGFNVYKSGSQSTGALSTGALTIARSAVKALPVIDDQIHESWFITEDGTGKGTSWDDAGGPERLVQLIYPDQARGAGAGLTAAWRLHKATIYVAAGTYNIQAANDDEVLAPHYNTGTLAATIKGGYPTGLTGTSTTGQDPAVNKTDFICNQTATTDHVFEVSGDNRVNRFTFDGITFTANPEATETAISGIAFNYTSSFSETSKEELKNVITFNNCIFEGITGSSAVGGSVIDINTTDGNPTINFTGCTFRNNITSGAKDNYGGAIRVDSGANITLNITNCTADNNDVTSASGRGGFLCQRRGTVKIDGGTIQNSNSAANAGAIFANNSTSILNIKDCTISNNEAASYGGVMYINSATVNIDGGTFSGNTSGKNGGAIYQNSGTIKIAYGTDSTKFIGNIATGNMGGAIFCKSSLNIDKAAFRENGGSNGGAIHLEAGANVLMEHSTFKRNTATNGGGAIYSKGIVTLDNSAVESCSAENGGALYIQSGKTGIDHCSFESNQSTNQGGALYIQNGVTDVTIKNSSIVGGQATSGAGVYIVQTNQSDYLPVSFYNTAIINNTATAGAGGLYSSGKNDLLMINCTVSGNSGTNGGGIYVTRYNNNSAYITRLSMVSCTVTGNTASTGIGGIYKDTYGQVVDVYNCIISGNTGVTDNDVRNAQLLFHVKKSIVVGTSYISADRVNNSPPVGSFQWRTSTLSEPSSFNIGTMLSALSGDIHVVKNITDNPAIQCGMTNTELSSLKLSYTPTQTLDTSFFAKDQKGNERTGSIMGAYVGTE